MLKKISLIAILFSIFNTKTKPKHQLVCHPYFTKNIFPEIENRHRNLSSEDYLLFPFQKNREKLYNKIAKTFTRISKELDLYYRNGSSRPIYSIRHTFIKNRYYLKASTNRIKNFKEDNSCTQKIDILV